MHLQDMIAELGREMGIPGLALDENGLCRLVFDTKLVVDLEASSDGKVMHVYSVVCGIPPENREAFYDSLLAANLFGQETGGAAFARDETADEILLCTRVNPDKTDFRDFVNQLEDFVNHLETWIEKLSGPARAEADKGGEKPEILPDDPRFLKV